MLAPCTTRKNLSLGEGVETLREWVSNSNDLEVTMFKRKEIYSVTAFVVCPSGPEGCPPCENDLLIKVSTFETKDLLKAESEFQTYTSNFL